MSALLQNASASNAAYHIGLFLPTVSLLHPTLSPFKAVQWKRAAETCQHFFSLQSHSVSCSLTSCVLSNADRPGSLFSGHSWLIEGRGEMQIWRDRSDPWKLCDVPCSAGAAELWRQDSRWARLGWGPFKSNRIASVPVPARATLSEQITCSSKGYDSPWHLCWDPAILDSCGLILNSYKCMLLCVWVCAWAPYSSYKSG